MLSAIPGVAVALARGGNARFAVFSAVLALAGSLAYLLLVGLIAADAGRRVRRRALAIAVTAPFAAIPVGVVAAALGFASLLLLPLVARRRARSPPWRQGRAMPQGVGALRRGVLARYGAFRRSVALAAIVEVLGVLLWLGLYIALSPLAEGLRAGTAAVVWGGDLRPDLGARLPRPLRRA